MQLTLNGLALGCIYTLMALGVNMIWKSIQVTNFANGQFVMCGAFMFAAWFVDILKFPYPIAIICTCICGMILGVFTAKFIYNPLRKLPIHFALIGTVGLSIMLRDSARIVWGAVPRTVHGFLTGTYRIGEMIISRAWIVIIFVTVSLLVCQELFLRKTKIGKAMRAVAQDRETASLMGINVKRYIEITVAYAGALFAVAGIMLIPLFPINTTMADTPATKSFSAAVIGGFGNSTGAIIGGPFIGIIESLFSGHGPAIWKDAVSYIILIAFLLLKPRGLVGGKELSDRA
jgi:branched-chain amino acid transport system permease protein